MLKKISFYIAITFWLAGCSNVPASTQAKLPLVSATTNYTDQAVLTLAHTNIREGQEIPVAGHKLIIGSAYLSALGQQCFRASDRQASATQGNQHAICKSMAGWQYNGPIAHAVSQ